VRRLQIYLDESIDDALGQEAERRGVSKGAVIRQALARDLGPLHTDTANPWLALAGQFTDGGVVDIDAVIYDRP
jgi:RNase P/RNase MRP subunit POP5